MVLRAALALTLFCLSGTLLPVIDVAVALDKNDPRYVQTECARAWNRCWDGCRSSSCYKSCNDKYDICLKIEIEAAPASTPGTGGTTSPPPKALRGTFGGATLPGATIKP